MATTMRKKHARPAVGQGGRPEVYDFSGFRVGETRFFSLDAKQFRRRSTKVHSAASYWGARHKDKHGRRIFRFSVRRQEKPKMGVFVTRENLG